jgi:hypothetical protein
VTRQIRYDAWSGADDWQTGVSRGATVADDALVIGTPYPMPGELDDYERGSWISALVRTPFRFTELVASWSAVTPPGSWVEIAALGERQDHPTADNHVLGRWSSGEHPAHRTSLDDDPETHVDVWRPRDGADCYSLALRLYRRPGTPGPTVLGLGVVVSAGEVRTSASVPSGRGQSVLDVPRLSQMTWKDAGGAGWCSPTSVSMVLAHAGRLPPGTDVPAAAREVFDPAYDGTGNWPFNTAWAASLADHAFVTRLHDLCEAEAFIAAGIPLVASVAYPAGGLPGAPTHATDGHLLVVRGFTAAGDVVTNDPAAPTERSVRRTYERAAFERAWLDGSGGLVYVIHRDDQPLPDRGRRGAW